MNVALKVIMGLLTGLLIASELNIAQARVVDRKEPKADSALEADTTSDDGVLPSLDAVMIIDESEKKRSKKHDFEGGVVDSVQAGRGDFQHGISKARSKADRLYERMPNYRDDLREGIREVRAQQ